MSTPENLARWTVALYGGDVLAPATLGMMTTPSLLITPDQEDYGLGTIIENGSDNDSELTLVGHTGGIGGYLTSAFYLREENVALIIMANRNPTDVRDASTHGWAAVLGVAYP